MDENSTAPSTVSKTDAAELEQVAGAVTRAVREIDGSRTDTWRCQATDALRASKPLKQSDLRQYWRELTNGNFNPLRFSGLLIRAFLMDCAHQVGLLKTLPLRGSAEGAPQDRRLNLQAGELVEVRTPKEIAATLDQRGENRRLSFDREMLPFCGQTFRVRERVEQIIDEKNGRMLKIPRDCIILDGVACSGERSVHGRWFCPRGIYPFWRESWLKRVEDAERS